MSDETIKVANIVALKEETATAYTTRMSQWFKSVY